MLIIISHCFGGQVLYCTSFQSIQENEDIIKEQKFYYFRLCKRSSSLLYKYLVHSGKWKWQKRNKGQLWQICKGQCLIRTNTNSIQKEKADEKTVQTMLINPDCLRGQVLFCSINAEEGSVIRHVIDLSDVK